jgi:hypothetical protein
LDNEFPAIRLTFGRRADVFEEGEVVMICDCDCIDAFQPAGSYEVVSILLPFIMANGISTLPVCVTGRVRLEITLVEMRTVIHLMPSVYRLA